MFNRLIIAVLTLGLLLTFSGIALGTNDAPKQGLNPVQKINPNAPRYQDLTAVQHATPEFQKPAVALNALETPTAILPPSYICSFIDYSGGAAAYYWKLPGVYGDDEMGMRFTSTKGYNCTLKTAYIGVYGSYLGASIGTPDMRVAVYDDLFGLPGVYKGHTVVPFASLPTSGLAYVPASLDPATVGGPFVYSDEAEFHIGVSSDNYVAPDTLAILSDDGSAGLDRGWTHYGGNYYTMLLDWGLDCNFLIGMDICCDRIPYTKCYTLDYDCGAYYYWEQPDAYGDDFFNMRMSVSGPETLVEIGVAIYGAPTVGTPDLDLYVWDDVGGFPGTVMPGFPVTIPWATVSTNFFPNYVTYTLPSPIVFRGDFHVGWSTNDANPGDVLAGLSDDGSCGTLRSSEYWGGAWGTMLADWGVDVNFLIYAQLCKDEFANCRTLWYYCNLAYFWRVPDVYGDVAEAMRFTPLGLGCRLEKFRLALYDNGDPNIYTTSTDIEIYLADGPSGLPGTLLPYTVTIGPSTPYVIYPGMQEIDYTGLPNGGVIFDGDIWVGPRPLTSDPDLGIRTLSDDGSCGGLRSGEDYLGYWEYMLSGWGVDINFIMEADVCCVPTPERPCMLVGVDNWPTYGHDFGRSQASLVSLGDDPQGELTKAWEYVATQYGNLNSAVIYNDTVVNYFLDHIVALDLNTGAEIWKVTDPSGLVIGGGCYATPTIYNLDAYGEYRTVVLTPGGDAKAFSALNLTDGSVYWTRWFMDHFGHFMTWGYSVVADCGGEPVVFYNDDDGDIYAVPVLATDVAPADGYQDLYTGWSPNPQNFGGSVLKGITLGDGYLYIGTDHNITDGNVTCVDACTGTYVWDKLTTIGEQLSALDPSSYADPPNQPEAHTGGIAFDPPGDGIPSTLFFASEYSPSSIDYNSGGIVYSVDATTGALNWANLGIGADYCGVAVDGAHVINTGWSPWVTGYGNQKGPTAYSKENGNRLYTRTTRNPGQDLFNLADGMLSCEFEETDLFVAGTRADFLSFYESDVPGRNIFHRRFAGGYDYGHHYQPSMTNGHMLFCYMNKLMCLTPQAPRPRLDIPLYILNASVPFGLVGTITVTWPDPLNPNTLLPGALYNLGAAPLTINSVTFADVGNGTIPPNAGDPGGAPLSVVDPGLIDKAQQIAAKFASNVDQFRASLDDEVGIQDLADGMTNSTRKSAAFAIPAWIDLLTITPVNGAVIPAPADYSDSTGNYAVITVDVNGALVPRGYTGMYAYIDSDDPDYFLDNATLLPTIQLGIVGGCLYEDVVMDFGTTVQNWAHIWNATMIADGDIQSNEIDGDHIAFWQGSFVFATAGTFVPPGKPPGVFSQRVAHYTTNWSAAHAAEWESILPDPCCVAVLCPPQHTANTYLGEISDDGSAWRDVYGDIVTYAMIDSVQDFCEYDTLGNCLSWDWNYAMDDHYGVQAPYVDTWTMGFHACVTVIGAREEARLNNFYIEKFDFDGRYGAVDDVWMGGIIDYDINYPANTHNVAGYDEDLSLAWCYCCQANDNGWGFVKIPFDVCGNYDHMVNAKTLTANMAGWNDSAVWLDSINHWMSAETGLSHQPGTDPVICAADPDDREIFFTLGELDIPAAPATVTMGVAIFGMPGITDADLPSTYAYMAINASKWCGFYRGDCDDDGDFDIFDIALMIDLVHNSGPASYPFRYLSDVNCDGATDDVDIIIMINYVIQPPGGPYPVPFGQWEL